MEIKRVDFTTRNAIVDAVVNEVIKKTDFGEVEYHPEYRAFYYMAVVLTNYTDYTLDENLSDSELFDDVSKTFIEIEPELPKRELEMIAKLIDEKVEYNKILFANKTAYSMTDASLAYLVEKIIDVLDEFADADIADVLKKIDSLTKDKNSMVSAVYKMIEENKKK